MTGGELLAFTGTGPAVVITALAADIAMTMVAGVRLVAHTAAYYEFDVQGDEKETVFALAILGVGVAARAANKAAAYCELSRVTQQLAQRGWWSKVREAVGGTGTLPNSPVVGLITRVLTERGFKATARNMEKAIPVIGVGLGAVQNAVLFRRIAATADRLYRERWLIERYGVVASLPQAPDVVMP